MPTSQNLGGTRPDLRNVAVIAHVDHGKTTLVDALLRQSGVFRANEDVAERVMDSMDLEREKGITILAKNAAIRRGDVKINIVDTPGHADFGGEVERALTMVDGVILLVDSAEGPRPQTRFVLRKALEAGLAIVLVVNKVDRPDARIAEVIDETYELFLDLGATEEQIEFPIVYTDARAGSATLEPAIPGTDMEPFFEVVINHVPPPSFDEDAPLRVHVTNLNASPYLGRIAVCRIDSGTLKRGAPVAWCRTDGSIQPARIATLTLTESLGQVEVEEAGPGEIVYVSGIDDVTIGDTLADPVDPRPLPVITVDEPTLSMAIGVNNSPVAGNDGTKLTARQIKARLDVELVGNVSIRVLPTERPDTWEVQGRGELQLAILVETMRREGFEMTVGKPAVLLREIDDTLHEPTERLSIDVPEEHVGAVTQMLGERKARLDDMTNHGTGWVRLDYVVAARALIGFRTEFMTETRGTGMLHHVFEGWEPWMGELRMRKGGSIVADRRGVATPYAITGLQERTTLFIGPTEAVYGGMIIGQNPRAEDMDVNICREKKLTNVRASSSDDTIRLTPPRRLSLEQALEYIADDECVEVTPAVVRLRKVELDAGARARSVKKLKNARV
ncbi:MAG: translational GTPase TypA [Acidimicrobiaceae bacterium]|nr:translational GTPase TypA [Acidimicrobiaceae bacterium]MBT5569309.1 translational GTPase TypA [Acidimicrobiaceae bacterium]